MCVSGEHRGLGPSISKVRSLKMDKKVWTEELIQVLHSSPAFTISCGKLRVMVQCCKVHCGLLHA